MSKGRHKHAPEEQRATPIRVFGTEAEILAWKRAAAKANKALSEYARDLLNDASREPEPFGAFNITSDITKRVK